MNTSPGVVSVDNATEQRDATTPAPTAPQRIASIDILRGLVMVLMAIDHVRVYAGVPPGGITADVFLTRWITHFCAPVFVFLAGTSAFLYGRKIDDVGALSRWLLVRGLWLVLLELTVVRLAWTFNIAFDRYMLAGVIWMLGWCFVLMSLIVRLPPAAVGLFGIMLIAGHNLIDFVPWETTQQLAESGPGWLWRILYFGGGFTVGGSAPNFLVLYTIVPWIGVMSAGYAFGALLQQPVERWSRACYAIGACAIGAFLVLRWSGIYGDPWPLAQHSADEPRWIAFLNTVKYPASLLFLLMTLGPAILAMPLLERARGRVAQWLTVFGRVPFFYYVLHIPLIHVVALLTAMVRMPDAVAWLVADHPLNPGPAPDGYRWSLPMLYAVFAGVIVLLYFPCRWFAALKAHRRDRWLSYM